MLNNSSVTANIPAVDIERARSFYADKLGLTPVDENPGGLIYKTAGGTWFFLYPTEYAGQAGHTIAQFHVADVADVAAEVAELEAKGVTFDTYEMPGVTWDGVIASLGDMGKAAWFKDSENNVLCIDDAPGM